MKALEDLEKLTEKEVLEHLVAQYSGKESGFDYGDPSEKDKAEAKKLLKNKKIVIAYESVGSWGCDSTSYFLLRDKKTKEYHEVHGSHCSCFGFEGQLDLEPTTIKYLKTQLGNGNGIFYTGGYDDNSEENEIAVKQVVDKL